MHLAHVLRIRAEERQSQGAPGSPPRHRGEDRVAPRRLPRFASILHSLWWATATLTTVGYGDVYPVTAGGKLFTFVILMCGLGIVAVPAGLVAAALSQVRQEKTERE